MVLNTQSSLILQRNLGFIRGILQKVHGKMELALKLILGHLRKNLCSLFITYLHELFEDALCLQPYYPERTQSRLKMLCNFF